VHASFSICFAVETCFAMNLLFSTISMPNTLPMSLRGCRFCRSLVHNDICMAISFLIIIEKPVKLQARGTMIEDVYDLESDE
jgi:hypothetical protein